MSLPSPITPATLDTVLGHLSGHFMTGSNGDLPTARHAASRMLAAYKVETEEELHLAADIVNFGFHALEMLSESAAPDLSLNNKLRLRTGAVSLSRETHKARRKLDQIQRARLTSAPKLEAQTAPVAEKAASAPDPTATDQALGLIKIAREAIQGTGRGGTQGFSLNHQQRRAAEKIAANLRRNKEEQERRDAAKQAAASAAGQHLAVS